MSITVNWDYRTTRERNQSPISNIEDLTLSLIRDHLEATESCRYVRCCKCHIFMNYDFTITTECFNVETTSWRNDARIRDGHTVHIFLSRENPSVYNGKMKMFAEQAVNASNHTVYIHIPVGRPALRDALERIFADNMYVKILTEGRDHVSIFKYFEFGIEYRFCVVKWHQDYIINGYGTSYGNPGTIDIGCKPLII